MSAISLKTLSFMKIAKILSAFAIVLSVALTTSCMSGRTTKTEAARDVIERTIGRPCGDDISLKIIGQQEGRDVYEISAAKGRLTISASSATAMCYAFNHYLQKSCGSMVTWSGRHMDLPAVWPDYYERNVSPYRFRYFLNVCTFGYTAPYWGWERWSEEIDWMALHGVNMPLASVASEAIARRVWMKMGLTAEEADSFFTGAAHLPWHRMGNLNSFDGPLTPEWHEGQIALQHKILGRMRALGMEPVAPAFAGFVPLAFIEKNPNISCTQLEWGGFPTECNACVLTPDSPYFRQLGAMFVEEWEKEFGKAKYFLSDSFNEMRLPLDENDVEGKHRLLADYGEAIYNSITAGDPDAVWVTQGWTFGYQHDFWDKESMQALLSRVPDDGLIIVDLGNDYPKWVWHTEQTWKVHEGFYGKQWIYSYVPNFGGKVLPTGDLEMYATGSVEALDSPVAGNLVGFGSAPEGLENNEVVYELLADMGWSSVDIDLDEWIGQYCKARYGSCSETMTEAWKLLRGSVYSSLYSYPRFTWQTVVPDKRRVSRHDINDDFGRAVTLFLSCGDECGASELYVNDAVEFASMWLGELADRHYKSALEAHARGKRDAAAKELEAAVVILHQTDKLLSSHPDYRLTRWVDWADAAGATDEAKAKYAANAKRLIATWGGVQEDYAARMWSGMIDSYYIPRLKIYFSDGAAELDVWEERWIDTPWHDTTEPYSDPVAVARDLVEITK